MSDALPCSSHQVSKVCSHRFAFPQLFLNLVRPVLKDVPRSLTCVQFLRCSACRIFGFENYLLACNCPHSPMYTVRATCLWQFHALVPATLIQMHDAMGEASHP